jgi:urease accessory protein
VDPARAALRSLARDGRALADVGRHGRLELRFGWRGHRTVVLHSYAEPPYRVGRVLPYGDGIHLILASSAPGIFGGDCLAQVIVVESGARVRITSQSAMQVHPNEAGEIATLASTYRVEGGGQLACEWDPLIPFADARLDQRIAIEVADGSSLFWSDAMMAGREARGERWRFSQLAHELRLVRNGTLAYMERYNIVPDAGVLERRWTADEASYFGTVLALGAAATREVSERTYRELAAIEGVCASTDLLEQNLLLARLVSSSGTSFREARELTRTRFFHSCST